MQSNDNFVFQTDSTIVKDAYQNCDNYLVEYDHSQSKEHCAVYFSSNEIYYPNDEATFQRSIIDQNRFEWFSTRIPYAHKHIFIRDIQKQWYLTGINSTVDTPTKLLAFLQAETLGYSVTTLGSSAGGFAAVLFGSQLGARLVLSFNGQFQITSLLKTSTESVNPILFRFNHENKFLDFFDIKPFMRDCSNIFYFYSVESAWDAENRAHVLGKSLNVISFKTSHHGVPFLKSNLPSILKMSNEDLLDLSGKIFYPLMFSINLIGVVNTFRGFIAQVINKYLK